MPIDEMDTLTKEYVNKAKLFAEKEDMRIRSIILFGGAVKGYLSKVSDRDTIFVFTDDVSVKALSSFRNYLEELEAQLGFREQNTFLQECLDRIGAQYKSAFACKYSDFINGDIARIFFSDKVLDSVIQDNPLLSSDIGLKNIILTAKTVQGENLLEFIKPRLKPINKSDLRLNRRMHFVLLFYASISFPFSKNSTKYALSAVKWALHTTYFGGFGKLGSLNDEVVFFSQHLSKRHMVTLKMFEALRESEERSFGFIMRSFALIYSLYRFTFKTANFPVSL